MRCISVILMFWFLASPAIAQRYSFLQRGVEEGLPVPVVNDLEKDPTGMIWLATDGGGLVRFDGERFTAFAFNDSLPSPFVTCIFNDSQNQFWIGTEAGVMVYDGVDLKAIADSPPSRINSIAEIDNQIWLATRTGLFVVENEEIRPHDALGTTEVLALAQLDHTVFYATKKGTFTIGESEFTSVVAEYNDVNRMVTLPNAIVLCAKRKSTVLARDSVFEIPLAGVRDAAITADGTLWLASQKRGLIRVKDGAVETINSENGLAFERVRSVLLDDSKIWLGSQQGLTFLQNPFAFALDGTQGIADESVHTALKIDDQFWLGTPSGIYVFEANAPVQHFDSEQGLPEGIVFDLVQHKGTIWAATEQGIAYLKNGRFIRATSAQGYDADFTFCMYSDGNIISVGTANGSMVALDKSRYERIPFVDSVPDGIVQIITGHRAEYHVGISGALYENVLKGLSRVKKWNDLELDTLSVFAVASSPTYECLLVNGDGIYILIGTRVRHINSNHGLRSLSFKSAVFVGDRLWVTTDKGVQFVDVTPEGKKPFVVGNVSEVSSINVRQFHPRSARVENGWFFNGSEDGLFAVWSEHCAVKPTPRLAIHEMNLFVQSQTDWSAFSTTIEPWTGFPAKLGLPHDQNYLSFRFNVAPSDIYDEELYVRFRLKGQEDNWSYANGRREAIFSSINPGTYTFEVEASRTRSFSQAAAANFSFRVIAPFWQTWWFITLVVLFLGGLVTFFVRLRIKQLNEKLELRSALADSERKSLRLQMNPHFVFNALDAISGFIFKNEPKEAVRYLGSFAKLMRLTLETSRERMVPLQSELQLLKNYIDLEQLRFNHKFSYTLKTDDEIDEYETMLPPMLVQPFVENAIKHGLKHREGTGGLLRVYFYQDNKHLICEVEDNGIGREASAKINRNTNKQSLATSITQERIELLTKSLGARVDLTIEDLKDADGEAIGTKAVIAFPQIDTDLLS